MFKNIGSLFAVILSTIFWLVFPEVNAGWLMVEEDGSQTMISEGKMKNFSEGWGTIMDGTTGEIILYSENSKMYFQGKIENYCTETHAMVEESLNSLTPEMRKMMEQMNTEKAGVDERKISIDKKGDGEEIAGFKTTKYNVLVDGEIYEELWLATDVQLLKDSKPLIGLLTELTKCTSSMDNEDFISSHPDYLKLFEQGVILKSLKNEEGETNIQTNVVELQKIDISSDEFEVPSGYKRGKFRELMAGEMK
jgi:hypothetical protein